MYSEIHFEDNEKATLTEMKDRLMADIEDDMLSKTSPNQWRTRICKGWQPEWIDVTYVTLFHRATRINKVIAKHVVYVLRTIKREPDHNISVLSFVSFATFVFGYLC